MNEAALRERFAPELPEALRRQIAEVEARLAATDAPPAPAGGQESVGSEGASAPEAEAGGGESQPTPGQDHNPPATPPADASDEVEELRRKLAALEQEARTWKGRERKEREQVAALQAQLDELRARLAEATKPTPEPGIEPLSDEDLQNYGPDLLDAALRYAMPRIEKRMEALKADIESRLEALEQGVDRVKVHTAEDAREKFFGRLDERTKDWTKSWREIDRTEEFGAWLDEEDPLTGVIRRNALVDACRIGDDARAVRFFEAFASQTGVSTGSRDSAKGKATPSGTEETTPTAPASQEAPAPSLEDFAAPGRPVPSQPSAAPIVQPGAKIWTHAEIAAYYRARARGDHPHSRDQAAAALMDAEIASAQAQGRVRA